MEFQYKDDKLTNTRILPKVLPRACAGREDLRNQCRTYVKSHGNGRCTNDQVFNCPVFNPVSAHVSPEGITSHFMN